MKFFEANYSNFHLVGFSFGGQLWGIVGRLIIEKTGNRFKIPRITGLDPGQSPPFINSKQLNENDAAFVDTIHVETQSYGSATAIGKVNFWVNGATSQPMCKHFVDLSELNLQEVKFSLQFFFSHSNLQSLDGTKVLGGERSIKRKSFHFR